MIGQYILDAENNPVPCDDLMAWAEWFGDTDKRTIAKTEINGCTVSTVFLGVDHQFGEGPPVLWESMVFSGGLYGDGEQRRYTSHADALAGHHEIVANLTAKSK